MSGGLALLAVVALAKMQVSCFIGSLVAVLSSTIQSYSNVKYSWSNASIVSDLFTFLVKRGLTGNIGLGFGLYLAILKIKALSLLGIEVQFFLF